MRDVVVQALAFGLGVTINPFVVIAMVLLLSAPNGRPKAFALLAGWALALLATSSVVLMFADSGAVDSGDDAPTWVRASMGVIAVALLLVAAKQWRSRPRGDEQPELPAWMDRFTAFSPWKTAQTGFALVIGNPKTLLLVAGAAVAVS
ncbi:MAG: GAP family protein, partial [Thermoleophilaceae bacterium]|nr:GAP family protein [Thermoleophilaceae bacterium]